MTSKFKMLIKKSINRFRLFHSTIVFAKSFFAEHEKTFVCAHTANTAWFFPAITVVISTVTQKYQRRIRRLFVSGVLCFKYALRDMCYMRIMIYEISKRRLENA